MSSPVFLDTNVLLYASLQPDPRSEAARVLLARRGMISVQVLNEFANVARRKLHRAWPEITTALNAIRVLCPPPLPLTLVIHEAALEIAASTGYQLYDALIIAAALEAGCTTLFSEDLHDGHVINGRLTIRNPFEPDK
jgi:predicted nucleic acid-binding protein